MAGGERWPERFGGEAKRAPQATVKTMMQSPGAEEVRRWVGVVRRRRLREALGDGEVRASRSSGETGDGFAMIQRRFTSEEFGSGGLAWPIGGRRSWGRRRGRRRFEALQCNCGQGGEE